MSDLCRALGWMDFKGLFQPKPFFDSVVLWFCGFMIPWVYDSMGLRLHGFLIPWVYGSVGLWFHGFKVLWLQDSMIYSSL